MGLLKRYKRTGWSQVGVPLPESVADHSFRVSVIASVLAAMEGADPQRAAFLALWHDSQETRTTDLPHLTKNYTTDWVSRDDVRAKLRSIIKRLLARYGYPPDAQSTATELVLRQMETFAEEWSPAANW